MIKSRIKYYFYIIYISKLLQYGGLLLDIFLMKVSFPIDELTVKEMKDLIQSANEQGHLDISLLMNSNNWKSYQNIGFAVLAYSEQDQLVGFLVANDLYGLNTFEWSVVVDPAFRRMGIGSALVEGLNAALEERGAAGDMAISFADEVGHKFLQYQGFEYNSSEATLQTTPGKCELSQKIIVRTYKEEDKGQLIRLMHDGFGDMPYETEELISLNTAELGRSLYMVEQNQQIIATVSLVENDMGVWITAFTVDPSLRKQGIGSYILQWTKNYAYTIHQQKVLLEVEIDNTNAISVYKKAGFTPISQIDYFTRV